MHSNDDIFLTPDEQVKFDQLYDRSLEIKKKNIADQRSLSEKEADATWWAMTMIKEARRSKAEREHDAEVKQIIPPPEKIIGKYTGDTSLSVTFAKDNELSDAIVYHFLQDKQIEANTLNDKENLREGIKWIRGPLISEIHEELACFPSKQTTIDAVNRLEKHGHIRVENRDRFPENDPRCFPPTTKYWWHVPNIGKANDIIKFRAVDAIQYGGKRDGIQKALILSYYYKQYAVSYDSKGRDYKKLVASEMAKELPMNEKTIRKHMDNLPFEKHAKGGRLFKLVIENQ